MGGDGGDEVKWVEVRIKLGRLWQCGSVDLLRRQHMEET